MSQLRWTVTYLKTGPFCEACNKKHGKLIHEQNNIYENKSEEKTKIKQIQTKAVKKKDQIKLIGMSKKTKLTLDDMKKIAREHGGQCHSLEYVNSNTKIHWECAKGHQWEATPSTIKSGKWCPKCAAIIKIEKINESREKHFEFVNVMPKILENHKAVYWDEDLDPMHKKFKDQQRKLAVKNDLTVIENEARCPPHDWVIIDWIRDRKQECCRKCGKMRQND